MIVHCVSFEHSRGGGGFDWYLKAEDADAAFETECANYDAIKSDPTQIHRFDCEVTSEKTADDEVEQFLMRCDFTPQNPIRQRKVGLRDSR